MSKSYISNIHLKISSLPETGYLRLSQILGNPKANPPIPPLIPVGKSTWWKGVKNGRFPAPVKLGDRITVWRVEDIRSLIENPNQVWPHVKQDKKAVKA